MSTPTAPKFTVHWYMRDQFRVVNTEDPAMTAMFIGPHAEERAHVYAQWMNAQVSEFAKQETEAMPSGIVVNDPDWDKAPADALPAGTLPGPTITKTPITSSK